MNAIEFRKLCTRAEGYLELGMLEDAVTLLEELPSNLKITKEVITLHMAILVKAGHLLKASYLGENLGFGEPHNHKLMLEVAQLKYDSGEPAEALRWLQLIEPRCRGLAAFHLLRAKCYAALRDVGACADELAKAHAIDPLQRQNSLHDPAFNLIYGAEEAG